ncbi:acetate--CoA ligase family protein [Streptomyces diastatochromogenes]|nr:acetate--CoA ligase family protein [Streptomyces diastatochromogenes]
MSGPGAEATEPQLKALLAEAGIAVPKGRIAASAEDAAAAVTEVGGTAVLKAVVPGLLHKTEAGEWRSASPPTPRPRPTGGSPPSAARSSSRNSSAKASS